MAQLLSFYITMAAIMALASVSTWLAFGGSPLDILNRVLRRLRVPHSLWRIRGNWYTFRDQPGSLTPVIVAGEIRRGLYDLAFHPGEVVVDIGSHIGMATIPWAKEHPKTRFVAYEPDPVNYANLVKNIKSNQVHNVQAINAGLSATPCKLSPTETHTWNTGGNRSQPTSDGTVPGITLQQIKDRHHPTVLKIDCEGAEFGAIQGNALADIESVIMEVHGHLGDPAPVLEAARKCPGYLVQVIQHPTEGLYVPGGRFPLKTTLQRHHANNQRVA